MKNRRGSYIKLLILGLVIVTIMAFVQLRVLNTAISYLPIISLGVSTLLIYFINRSQKSEGFSNRQLFLISIPLILANLTAHILIISIITLVVFGYLFLRLRNQLNKKEKGTHHEGISKYSLTDNN